MVELQPYELVWELRQEAPELYGTILDSQEGLPAALASLEGRCPVASTVRPFREDRGYFRATGHARSFSLQTDAAGEGGIITFKGTEPAAQDCVRCLHSTHARRPIDFLSRLEQFVMFEHEVFLGVTLKGALSCAQVTHRFVEAFYDKLGRLPRTPLPLQVFRLPDETVEAFLRESQPYLSDRAQFSVRQYTQQLASEGLAVYVYAYPGSPVRLAHRLGSYPGAADGQWDGDDQDRVAFDPMKAIRGWTGLFADMLLAGYVPTTWLHTGHCFQPQNLVIDGGVCDIDSVEPIADIFGHRDLVRSVLVSLSWLSDAVGLVLKHDQREVPSGLITTSLWEELRTQLRGHEEELDFRVRGLLEQEGFDLLERIARNLTE